MHQTRQYILDILREAHESTVDEIVVQLRKRRDDTITAVTVRHHLNELLRENLITSPHPRHRTSPGRPQHVYSLTDKAQQYFPSNYQSLASNLIAHLCENLPELQVNVILEGVADRMAAQSGIKDCAMEVRLAKVVNYLNEHGYNASWDAHSDGYILKTTNCPYHNIAERGQQLCDMDMRLISSLLGVVPRLLDRISSGSNSCAYLIPISSIS